MDIGTYNDRLKRIELRQLIMTVFKDFESIFMKENIKQVRKGLKSDGSVIGHYRNTSYARWKQEVLGSLAPAGVIDLTVTRAFTEGIFINFTESSMIFDSTDGKASMLREFSWWDEKVFGLSNESLQGLKVAIIEKMQYYFNEKMKA